MSAPAPPGQPRLLDRVRHAIRARHYSLRTEEAYVGWIRRYILFHKKRHPMEMGEVEINAFVTHLAVAEGVGASTRPRRCRRSSFSIATSWRKSCPISTSSSAPSGLAAFRPS